jgi:hypothetical protein
MDTLLNRVVKEHQKLLSMGREPDSLFLSGDSQKKLAEQAASAYHIQRGAAMVELLGMGVYPAEQYLGETFRIVCKPQFGGEF